MTKVTELVGIKIGDIVTWRNYQQVLDITSSTLHFQEVKKLGNGKFIVMNVEELKDINSICIVSIKSIENGTLGAGWNVNYFEKVTIEKVDYFDAIRGVLGR